MSSATVRPARTDDRAAIAGVVEGSFGEEGQQRAINSIIETLRDEGHMRHELVAEVGGAVVGYVALSRGWIDARPRLVEACVLSPLGVLPDHQAAGAGTALLAAALEVADASGVPLVFLEGSPGYYSARGFRPAADLGLTPPSARIPGPACQAAPLRGYEDWMSGGLVYPDAWWRHDLVGLRDPLLAELEGRFSD